MKKHRSMSYYIYGAADTQIYKFNSISYTDSPHEDISREFNVDIFEETAINQRQIRVQQSFRDHFPFGSLIDNLEPQVDQPACVHLLDFVHLD